MIAIAMIAPVISLHSIKYVISRKTALEKYL